MKYVKFLTFGLICMFMVGSCASLVNASENDENIVYGIRYCNNCGNRISSNDEREICFECGEELNRFRGPADERQPNEIVMDIHVEEGVRALEDFRIQLDELDTTLHVEVLPVEIGHFEPVNVAAIPLNLELGQSTGLKVNESDFVVSFIESYEYVDIPESRFFGLDYTTWLDLYSKYGVQIEACIASKGKEKQLDVKSELEKGYVDKVSVEKRVIGKGKNLLVRRVKPTKPNLRPIHQPRKKS